MKHSMMKLVSGLAVTAAGLVFAQAASAGITGTKHDLSIGGAYGTNQICIFCHAPHNTGTIEPLWNHTMSAVASYTTYSSATLNATVGQPGGTTKLCLSCHDGTVAVDAFTGHTPVGTTITGAANLTSNLSNDHPVSFTYDAGLVALDSGLVTPASGSLVVAGIPLFSSKLECASCHQVHDNTNGDFLRASNAGSALCLKCHIK